MDNEDSGDEQLQEEQQPSPPKDNDEEVDFERDVENSKSFVDNPKVISGEYTELSPIGRNVTTVQPGFTDD